MSRGEVSADSGFAAASAHSADVVPRHTPGPWGWFGNQYQMHLATVHGGRRFVMGFKRRGTQGAEPTFQERHRMVPASEMVRFQVGDGNARGMTEGKADPSVYRLDIEGIDHPDAYLIAAAPDLLDAALPLVAEIATYTPSAGEDDDEMVPVRLGDLKALRAAIAKAEGRSL